MVPVQSPESAHSGFGEGVPHSGLIGTHSSPRKAPIQDSRVVYSGPRGTHSSPRDAHSNPKGAYSSPGDAHSGLRGCPLKPQGLLIARRCHLRAQRGVHLVFHGVPIQALDNAQLGLGDAYSGPRELDK